MVIFNLAIENLIQLNCFFLKNIENYLGVRPIAIPSPENFLTDYCYLNFFLRKSKNLGITLKIMDSFLFSSNMTSREVIRFSSLLVAIL